MSIKLKISISEQQNMTQKYVFYLEIRHFLMTFKVSFFVTSSIDSWLFGTFNEQFACEKLKLLKKSHDKLLLKP